MPVTRDGVANKNFSLPCSFCSRPVDPTLPEKKLGPRLMRYAGILKIKPLMQIFRVCSTDNFLSQIFSPISKVSGMLHYGSVGRVHSKESYFLFTCTFSAFFCCFSPKKCVFIISIPFLIKYRISATEC